jgi:DNA replication protein DnaC
VSIWRICGCPTPPRRCPGYSTTPASRRGRPPPPWSGYSPPRSTPPRPGGWRQHFACLPATYTLADYDYSAQPGIDAALIRDLASLRFLDEAANVLFIGPPGVGKTMLAIGLARAAIEAGHRVYFTTAEDLAARCTKAAREGRWNNMLRFYAGPKLLVIDEFGYRRLGEDANAALFQVISQRYLKSSVIITSHAGVATWAERFTDPMMAAAILDRLLHRGIVAAIEGPSYRMRAHQARAEKLRAALRP